MPARNSLASAALWLSLLAVGCSQPIPEPEIASSAPHAVYAESYPKRVDAELAGFGDNQIELKKTSDGFGAYPAALDDKAEPGMVADMIEEADQVGRSGSYVDNARELQAVRRFYDEEREEIRKKVAGTVAYQAKQKNCDADLGGAAAGALDKSMEERLEKRLHDANSAARMVDRQRESLGKKNAEALDKQLTEVAHASYLAHIALVEHKLRLRQMAEEAEQVKKTADAQIEIEKEFQRGADVKDADKKDSQARLDAMTTAKSGADAAAKKAQQALEDIEPRIEKAQKAYQDALAKLVKAFRDRAKG